jgi:hypothetical protein
MKFRLDRIISVATLVASVVAIFLVLKKPAPVAQPQNPTVIVERATSDQKTADPQREPQPSQMSGPTSISGPAPVFTAVAASSTPAPSVSANLAPPAKSEEVSSTLSKLLGAASGGLANLTPNSNVGSSMPNIKDQQVTMEGDIIHGRFLTEIAGKDVWVTISGHMGEKDGYATFDPTEIKVGDMEVPVSLVNPALQRKLAEERDRLKIPTSSTPQ